MSNITASMVKELRETSGAGMMDCKAALQENNGDMAAAVDWLRTKGLAKAAKKAGRVAAEGLVAVASAELPVRRSRSTLKPISWPVTKPSKQWSVILPVSPWPVMVRMTVCWRLIIRVPANRLKTMSPKWSARLART